MHPMIADYVARHGIVAPTPFSGRLTIIIDDRYRVHMQAGPQDMVFLLCRLAPLPPKGALQEEWLLNVGKLAVGTLSRHSACCVVDQREVALWLQQAVQLGGDASIDESLGEFVNALSFWVSALPRLV